MILNFHLCKGELSKLSGSFVAKWEELYAWCAHPMSIKLNAQEQCSRGETRSENTPEGFFSFRSDDSFCDKSFGKQNCVVYNRENTCVLSEFQKVRYVIVIICSQIMLEQFDTMDDSAPQPKVNLNIVEIMKVNCVLHFES